MKSPLTKLPDARLARVLPLLTIVPFTASGAWTLIDDFESGDLSAWTETQSSGNMDGDARVTDDPLAPDGTTPSKVMEIFPGTLAESSTNNFRVYREIPAIAFGSSGTVYMRVGIPNPVVDGTEIPAQVSEVWGLTSVDEPTAWGDYSTAMTFSFYNTFDVYDGTETSYVTVVENYTRNVWYDMWIVARNEATGQQDYQVWVQGPGFGESAPALAYPAEEGTYTPFRLKPDGESDPASAGLDRLLFTSTTGNFSDPRAIDPTYFDDIYIDLDGANLSVPGGDTATYGGFVIDDDYINTEAWLGWLYVGHAPWVYSLNTSGWLYLPEEAISEDGAWTYIPQ